MRCAPKGKDSMTKCCKCRQEQEKIIIVGVIEAETIWSTEKNYRSQAWGGVHGSSAGESESGI